MGHLRLQSVYIALLGFRYLGVMGKDECILPVHYVSPDGLRANIPELKVALFLPRRFQIASRNSPDWLHLP